MSSADVDAFFEHHLGSSKVMAILRGYGPERTVDLCRRAWALGITLVEVPVQSDRDMVSLAAALVAGHDAGRPVGAGTVTSTALMQKVADAGVAFTVAPGLDEQVLQLSRQYGLPHLPGVATATETHRALQLGLVWQKAFPAAALGSEWFAAIRGPFPQVRLVATGGIDLDNAGSFLEAGAAAVSLGSAFANAPGQQVIDLIKRWHRES
jgi:2-dehydro-3-deoxyphosphogluconate aldolase / (4S)-4-hydroxy-2-oxoglutarate aldolase